MELIADIIDEACDQALGHTNWAYLDTMSEKEMGKHYKNNAIEFTVVFFKEPLKEVINER